jgi:hypothetical protein
MSGRTRSISEIASGAASDCHAKSRSTSSAWVSVRLWRLWLVVLRRFKIGCRSSAIFDGIVFASYVMSASNIEVRNKIHPITQIRS